ncbi:hypothetical protein GCM10009839_00390 [Catenulispora yoronensis]|uniref:Uncharacterized protein n=1 Tax=Catenulispora yoronensis TaxID=450799 RepID=A0ABN2TI45_9ACTN
MAPWHGSVEETFAALQNQVFAEFFSSWPEADRPADIAELWSGDEKDEDSWAGFMGEHSPLYDDDGRWTGRCVVLHGDAAPEAVAFWGHSGD